MSWHCCCCGIEGLWKTEDGTKCAFRAIRLNSEGFPLCCKCCLQAAKDKLETLANACEHCTLSLNRRWEAEEQNRRQEEESHGQRKERIKLKACKGQVKQNKLELRLRMEKIQKLEEDKILPLRLSVTKPNESPHVFQQTLAHILDNHTFFNIMGKV